MIDLVIACLLVFSGMAITVWACIKVTCRNDEARDADYLPFEEKCPVCEGAGVVWWRYDENVFCDVCEGTGFKLSDEQKRELGYNKVT